MSLFNNKTALISGGAEGIGLSIATALGDQGMNVVLGDIDAQMLDQAKQKLTAAGVAVEVCQMDVSKPEDWRRFVDCGLQAFGKLHMLVNNAGVASAPGAIEDTNHEDWRWVIDVNLMGVIYGAEAVVPHIKSHQEGGWVVNVASMAGMNGVPYAGSYTATKVAVVGMSEAWHAELAPHNIHVSALCPAFVQTRIHKSGRNRQEEYLQSSEKDTDGSSAGSIGGFVEDGIDVDIVGKRVVEALKDKELYIFTHPSYHPFVEERFAQINAAFERAAQSPLLADLPDSKPVSFG